jgi:zinc protease
VVIAPPGGGPKAAREASSAETGAVRLVRLPNGLRVLVKRHSNLPLVNIQAYTLGSSLVDSEKTAGRSDLVAEMLDKGTAAHSAQQIAHFFDSIGGQVGFEAGRFTVFGSATTLRADFPQAAALFAECFLRPAFPEEEFEKAKRLALGHIARRADDPHAEIAEAFADALLAATPYHLMVAGKADTVKRLTTADLRQYHQRYFVPQNMVVAVFGDMDPDEALALVRRHFGGLKPDPGFRPIRFDRPNALPQSVDRHKQTGKETGMIMLGYPAESIFDQRDHAAMTVLRTIMSGYGYPSGWLHNELRGAGLVYAVQATQLVGPSPGYFVVLAQTQPDKLSEVVGHIRRDMARAKEGKIPAEEFRTAVQQIVALHAQENTTIGQQARQAALDELYGLGHDYDKGFDARIQAVTPAEVVAVARKYLDLQVLVTSSPGKREP